MNGPFPPLLRYVVELNESARPESRGGEATLGRTMLAPMNSAEGAVRYRRRRRRSMKVNDIKARTTRAPTDPPAIAPIELGERVDLLDGVGDTALVTVEMGEEVEEVFGTWAVELVDGNVVPGAGVIGLTSGNEDSTVEVELAPETERVVPEGIEVSEPEVVPAEDVLRFPLVGLGVVVSAEEVLIVDVPSEDCVEEAACALFDGDVVSVDDAFAVLPGEWGPLPPPLPPPLLLLLFLLLPPLWEAREKMLPIFS